MAWLFGKACTSTGLQIKHQQRELLQMKHQQSNLLTLEIVFCTPVAWLFGKACTSTGLKMKRQQCNLINSEIVFCDLLTLETVFCATVAWLFGKSCTSTETLLMQQHHYLVSMAWHFISTGTDAVATSPESLAWHFITTNTFTDAAVTSQEFSHIHLSPRIGLKSAQQHKAVRWEISTAPQGCLMGSQHSTTRLSIRWEKERQGATHR